MSSGAYSQLRADVQKLQTELQSLAAKSGLTIADLENLANDSQAINQAGFFFNVQSLDKAVSELATAVAGGTSTAQAQTDFAAFQWVERLDDDDQHRIFRPHEGRSTFEGPPG